jgi:hypothetical protein
VALKSTYWENLGVALAAEGVGVASNFRFRGLGSASSFLYFVFIVDGLLSSGMLFF